MKKMMSKAIELGMTFCPKTGVKQEEEKDKMGRRPEQINEQMDQQKEDAYEDRIQGEEEEEKKARVSEPSKRKSKERQVEQRLLGNQYKDTRTKG
jgi:hypothetical protein